MELNLSGISEICLPAETRKIRAGAFAIIPPRIPHGFRYLQDSNIVTVMFDFPQMPEELAPCPIFSEDTTGAPVSEIFLLLKAIFHTLSLRNIEKRIFEGLIKAILESAWEKNIREKIALHPYVQKAKNFIEENIKKSLPVSVVAKAQGVSSPYLSALFKKEVGISLKRYITEHKISAIKKYLLYTDLSVTAIAARCGFQDIYTFSRFVKHESGKSPSMLRKIY